MNDRNNEFKIHVHFFHLIFMSIHITYNLIYQAEILNIFLNQGRVVWKELFKS